MIDLKRSAELNSIEPIKLYSWLKKHPKSDKRLICYCDVCGREYNIRYKGSTDLCRKCAIDTYWSQENRDVQSERKKEYWGHQENRDAQSKRKKEYCSHQENIDIFINRMKEYWGHQENRDDHGEKIRQQYIDHPEKRDEVRELLTQHNKDHPETPEMLFERSKKISATKQGVKYDDWEDVASNINSLYCSDFDNECRE